MSVYRNDRKKVVRTDISAESVIPAADATGSGDVFGAAFHYHYVKTTDLLGSAGYAVHLTASRLVPRGPNRTG
jgi:sugar/nucleoside kinase (ribokinase family)